MHAHRRAAARYAARHVRSGPRSATGSSSVATRSTTRTSARSWATTASSIVDTRISHRQADEILADLRTLTPLPVRAVVNTHGHNDHAFGNHRFRPAPIWGHDRCARMIRETGARPDRGRSPRRMPDLAAELAEVVLDPPDRTFDGDVGDASSSTPAVGRIELRHLGRGHTDNDIVVLVPDADVLFAGDLVENGAPPYFGDGYPIDWPATVERMVELVTGAVVPGPRRRRRRGVRGPLDGRVPDDRRAGDARPRRACIEHRRGRRCGRPTRPTRRASRSTRALAQLRGELDSSAQLGDADHPATARLAGEDRVERRLQVVERRPR